MPGKPIDQFSDFYHKASIAGQEPAFVMMYVVDRLFGAAELARMHRQCILSPGERPFQTVSLLSPVP
jgi:hypothetical protein